MRRRSGLPRFMRTTAAVSALAGASLLQACGELASGGAQGEAVALVTGNGGSGAPAAFMPGGSGAVVPRGSSAAGGAGNGIRGTVSVQVQLSVRAPDGTWIELTRGPSPASVDIEGTLELEVGRRRLDVGTYDSVRVQFRRVEADVTEGLVIDGLPLVGRIAVDFGAKDTIEVERTVAVTVREGAVVELVVDLNSDTWLRGANPVARVVPPGIFRNAIEVRVR